jgi:hypothetical protein
MKQDNDKHPQQNAIIHPFVNIQSFEHPAQGLMTKYLSNGKSDTEEQGAVSCSRSQAVSGKGSFKRSGS